MTPNYGTIMQTGFVVRDIERAMRHWTQTLGVGPFWITERVAFKEITYRGAPANLEMAVAVAFSGGLQIELIQTLNDAPSIYRDHLITYGEGLQHLGILTDDYDAAVQKARADGRAVVQAGTISSGLRFAYIDTAGPLPGTMIELIEQTPGMQKFLARLAETARTWDGTDAIRKL
jgi:methylmalonyl-CoA/ethylmalonyl-CoA epimerase